MTKNFEMPVVIKALLAYGDQYELVRYNPTNMKARKKLLRLEVKLLTLAVESAAARRKSNPKSKKKN